MAWRVFQKYLKRHLWSFFASQYIIFQYNLLTYWMVNNMKYILLGNTLILKRIPCKVDNRKNIEIKELNVNINADVLPPPPLASSSIVNQNVQPSKTVQYCLETLLMWWEITHVHRKNKYILRLCPSFNAFLFCSL